jgi:MFS family permease
MSDSEPEVIEMLQKTAYMRIFRNRDFVVFWTGLVWISLGRNFYTISLYWWLLQQTESSSFISAVLMFSYVPMFIFGVLSGSFVDRFDRKKLLVSSVLFDGVFIAAFPLLHYFGFFSVWQIYLIVFLQGAASILFCVTANTVIPQLVSKNDLMASNSLVDIGSWAANIIGFITGGFLVGSLGAINLMSTAPLFLILSAFCMTMIRTRSTAVNNSGANIRLNKTFANLADGFKVIMKDKAVLVFIVTWMGIQMLFAGGPMSFGWPLFVTKVLKAGSEGYGIIIAALSATSLLGSVFVGQLGSVRRKGRLIMVGFLWGAIGMFMLTLTTSFWTAVIIAGAWNVCFPLINIPVATTIQERVSNQNLGTVMGFSNALASAMTLVSMMVTGIVMDNTTIVFPFQLFAAALAVCFLLVYLVKAARTA